MPHTEPVVIVGGGWAGLSAAVELARHEIPVILLESAKQLGGRARSVNVHGLHLDNGQHMLLGAYESTLDVLRTLGVNEDEVLERQPLSLRWYWPGKKTVRLRTPPLPAPLHLAWGLLSAKGLSLRDRLAALKFSRAMERSNFSLAEDCSVLTLLQKYRQSPTLIKAIWEPLCLGALNTQIHEASAQIFLHTLGNSFNHTRSDSDLLLTRTDLGSILPGPALDFIESRGGSVRLGQRVTGLRLDADGIAGVELRGDKVAARQVILATPHIITRRLCKPHAPLQALNEQLERLEPRPICTVYLQYSEDTRLGHWMHGSLDTAAQWTFDRHLYGQPGLMAVVISGDGPHNQLDNEALCDTIERELAEQFPRWPKPLSRHVIREKRATFASTVNINRYRPAAQTAINGLWLAGDYTDVGLPATLEGAVRSGLNSAQQVIRARQRSDQQDTV
jgi:squalene-associated FAD-dependent desaturase